MKFKALMIDIDGTLVDYDHTLQTVPTPRVKKAVSEASKRMTVCVATGRSFASAENIINELKLHNGLAIINNGAQVLDLKEKKVLHEQAIDTPDAKKVFAYLTSHSIPYEINSKTKDPVSHKGYYPKGTVKIFLEDLFSEPEIDLIISDLSSIPSLSVTKSKNEHPNRFGLTITHVDATKQVGILKVAEILGISTHEIIGIGDGYNDFPLLMACGLKVAMGNAVPDLKAIADYVAPPVTEDGVADVIEKFVLHSD
jgi:HAD superfamily hydrolase (TIGR01484 family)